MYIYVCCFTLEEHETGTYSFLTPLASFQRMHPLLHQQVAFHWQTPSRLPRQDDGPSKTSPSACTTAVPSCKESWYAASADRERIRIFEIRGNFIHTEILLTTLRALNLESCCSRTPLKTFREFENFHISEPGCGWATKKRFFVTGAQ